MDSGPAGGSKIREREERGRVKQEEGRGPRFYEPASVWGSRWPVAEGTGAATGCRCKQGNPGHPHTSDLLIFVAQLTQNSGGGAKRQQISRMVDRRREAPSPRRISGMGGVGGSGETVFQVWRGNKDPCRCLFFDQGLHSFSAWSQFRSHQHTTSDRPGPSPRLFAVADGTGNMRRENDNIL